MKEPHFSSFFLNCQPLLLIGLTRGKPLTGAACRMHTHESALTGLFQHPAGLNSQDLVTLQQARKICDGGVAAGMTTKSPSRRPVGPSS